ncbi:MAG: transglutaminase-like domain-containing protein [Pseudomonadota bacterium]
MKNIFSVMVLCAFAAGCSLKTSPSETKPTFSTVPEAVGGLLAGAGSDEEKLRRLFNFVRDGIRFDFIYPQDAPVERILREGRGVCMQKANLLVALVREAGFTARFRFIYVSKQALVDFLPDFAYQRWEDPFPHTFPEINFNGKWVALDPSFDRELHELCLEKGINFARFPFRNKVSLDFSVEGVIGHQQYFEVQGRPSFVGDDLAPLIAWRNEHAAWYKRMLQPMIFRKASAILADLRREGA